MATPNGEVSMMFSRRFRALLRLALIWSIPWVTIGVIFGVRAWRRANVPPFPPFHVSLGTFLAIDVLMYGGMGFISGIAVGLVLARVERDQNVAGLSVGRAAFWGVVGGLSPLALFLALALALGPAHVAWLTIVVPGIASAVISSAVVASTVAAAKHGRLQQGSENKELRAI